MSFTVPPPLGFAAADALARVFDDFAMGRNRLGGIHTPTMNTGRAGIEPVTGQAWVNPWCHLLPIVKNNSQNAEIASL